ncbi:hypothetical protein BRDID11004_66050 [Bradyrhizobium diazoefficiens]|uniref:Uncharacterized protein n=1 Tax=Bradyrhizobium diazoefficiens TaxID=1355477 RepID=A0A810AFT1_9BRAD|nr:hypothetical protein BDHF08_20990 [Bradyrhizobium diazoefficiens]BCE54586.1 hypothetical protein XF5B_20980 [Bradyrhizobium diazoefficiens]BCE63319.1 hypothetical protein XF6B_21180 [Bradyrhizobium diazoefficiens]
MSVPLIILVSHLSKQYRGDTTSFRSLGAPPYLDLLISIAIWLSLIRERVGCLAPDIKASIGTLSERDVRMKFTIAQLQQCRHLASEDMPKLTLGAMSYNIVYCFTVVAPRKLCYKPLR